MIYAVKPPKNKFKWYRSFVIFPRRTIDHYRVFLSTVWKRQNKSLTEGIFWTHGREYTVNLPLEEAITFRDTEKPKPLSCIVCENNQYPLCPDCKKAIMAFRSICD